MKRSGKMGGKGFSCCLIGLFGLFLVVHGYPTDTHTEDTEEGGEAGVSKPKPLVKSFERKNWVVAASLFKEAAKSELENLIFSPVCLTNSMVMLIEGAGGETAREIQTVFVFKRSSETLIRSRVDILNSLKNQTSAQGGASGVTLETASKIFANVKNAKISENYTTAVSSLGEVETLDFSEPTQVVNHMNEWVKNQTHGKISKIVETKDVDAKSAVVFLNALYLNAPWKTPFNKSNTKKADFHVSERDTVQVDMMEISADFPYADLHDFNASVAFLPYQGDKISMAIYLPWKGRKLSTLEEKLETLVPSEIRKMATTETIVLSLPKFSISSSLDFKPILTAFGVPSMFNKTAADFSKLSETPEFHVSKLVQQVLVQVNEEGTEAVAVTEAAALGLISTTNNLKVDRPFIFQIFDSGTGTILLTGRVTNPNGKLDPVPTPAPTQTPAPLHKGSLGYQNNNEAPNSNHSTASNCTSVGKKSINSNPLVTITSTSARETAHSTCSCQNEHGANAVSQVGTRAINVYINVNGKDASSGLRDIHFHVNLNNLDADDA